MAQADHVTTAIRVIDIEAFAAPFAPLVLSARAKFLADVADAGAILADLPSDVTGAVQQTADATAGRFA